jgi:hypothetical protein
MARESALWDRLKTAGKALRLSGHLVDIQRLENLVGVGHPDVEGCIDGAQIWIELKSEMRPARPWTTIHPKKRPSQAIWHRERSLAGCTVNWILLQVGEATSARLYLVPGWCYDKIEATEAEIASLSVVPPNAFPSDVLLRAAAGW